MAETFKGHILHFHIKIFTLRQHYLLNIVNTQYVSYNGNIDLSGSINGLNFLDEIGDCYLLDMVVN